MRTRLIHLYGAPSSGKSVKMLQLATVAKLQGLFCEICPEVAKEYVIQEIAITPPIQRELTIEQHRRLTQYIGYVDYVVTDAPLLIGAFYAQDNKYSDADSTGLLKEFKDLQNSLRAKADFVNVYVTRRHPFVQHGRYQTEAHAMQIEHDMLAFVRRHHDPATLIQVPSTSDPAALWQQLQHAAIEPTRPAFI